VAEDVIKKVVQSFIGEIKQKVPAFSAVKINGKRAYEMARKGIKVETPTRVVRIYNIEVLEYAWPKLVIRAEVSSGTYIRTLGEDIGRELRTGAYLTALRRTKIDKYRVEDAKTLADFGIV
jgi:tRNA pseudouridine55 synthase